MFDSRLRAAFEKFEEADKELNKILNFPTIPFDYEKAHYFVMNALQLKPEIYLEDDLVFLKSMETYSRTRGGGRPWKHFKDHQKVRLQRITVRYYDELRAIAKKS